MQEVRVSLTNLIQNCISEAIDDSSNMYGINLQNNYEPLLTLADKICDYEMSLSKDTTLKCTIWIGEVGMTIWEDIEKMKDYRKEYSFKVVTYFVDVLYEIATIAERELLAITNMCTNNPYGKAVVHKTREFEYMVNLYG